MLDLLVCKAESYSHFIRNNLAVTSLSKPDNVENSGKRKTSPDNKPRKKAKTASENNDFANIIAPSLIGGTLMEYQLEGVRWLASLWENGVSGILADEVFNF